MLMTMTMYEAYIWQIRHSIIRSDRMYKFSEISRNNMTTERCSAPSLSLSSLTQNHPSSENLLVILLLLLLIIIIVFTRRMFST